MCKSSSAALGIAGSDPFHNLIVVEEVGRPTP